MVATIPELGRVRVAFIAAACAVWLGCDPIGLDDPTEVPLAGIEDALERAYCERMLECTCTEGRRFDDVGECVASISAEADALRAQPDDPDIAYDPFCVGERVDDLDALGCSALPVEDDLDGCKRPCRIFHGDRGEGSTCRVSADGSYSDCNKRLHCVVTDCDDTGCTGVCADPCATTPPDSSNCGGCTPTHYCDAEGSDCLPLPGAGERCGNGSLCADDLLCVSDPSDPTAVVCQGPAEPGAPCSAHGQCASGFCPSGTCEAPPIADESCADAGVCAAGLQCDAATTVCVAADALICTSPSGLAPPP